MDPSAVAASMGAAATAAILNSSSSPDVAYEYARKCGAERQTQRFLPRTWRRLDTLLAIVRVGADRSSPKATTSWGVARTRAWCLSRRLCQASRTHQHSQRHRHHRGPEQQERHLRRRGADHLTASTAGGRSAENRVACPDISPAGFECSDEHRACRIATSSSL
jgi:hypothetical protein